MVLTTKLRSWGSSLGIVVPKEIVRTQHLEEGDEVIIELKKKQSLREVFGSFPKLAIDAQKMKEELRKEWAW